MLGGFVVAIASGKGGTGKTTVAANLARAASDSGWNVQYLDCDVEEPNGHIFLKPQISTHRQVTIDVPQVDPEKCSACGECGQICQYGAIVCIQENVLTFEQLCHSCGGCFRVCPEEAIAPKPLEIGTIETGKAGQIDFVSGQLKIGHVRTPTLIKEVKKHIHREGLAIVDVPPGTSCPVVEAIKDTDFVLLVTEPTPFGLNDLKLAVELVRELNLPFAVAVNRDGIGDEEVDTYCAFEDIDAAFRLPDDRRIAKAYSSGKLMTDALKEYREYFSKLCDYLEDIKKKLNEERRLRIQKKNIP
jgi:MinD superfamily P-loop ATPase